MDTTSSTGIELKVGKISAVPSDVTDAFVAIHDTGGPGSLAGDLVLVPRSSNGVDNAVRIYSGYTTPVERLGVGNSELAINDPSNDYNFRVEANSNTHMLFIDASNDVVNIGTNVNTLFNDSSDNQGINLYQGTIQISRVGGTLLFVNRQNSNGELIDFRINGSQKAAIGTDANSNPYLHATVQDSDFNVQRER